MQYKLSVSKGFFLNWICFIPIFLLLQSACKKDKSAPSYAVGTNENINTWLLDSLKRYYYWSESLPSNPNISVSPKDFFASVRNPADRFSYIIIPNDPSTGTPNNKNFGFDYTTIQEQNTGQAIGIIKLVLKDSPASRAGLKRGDYINKINGKLLTATNAAALQEEILASDHFSLGTAEFSGNAWVDLRSVNISNGVTLDQRETSKIIESGGKKIGYIYFQDFNPGLATSLNSVFAGFKSAGVTDLILDLRYNSGGQVSEAAGLSAMIAAGVSYDKPFITYKGNKNGGVRTESIGSTATFDGTVNFNILLQNNLGLNRVYILGTAATASASEVMVNNLKTFIQVVLVGGKTRGKDEASFNIYDSRVPKQVQWEMHPIVYKLFNAAGNGGYSAGITPDLPVDELNFLPLLPFGEITDPLVNAAVVNINGKTTSSVDDVRLAKKSNLTVGAVLTDTKSQAAQNSIVITHQ